MFITFIAHDVLVESVREQSYHVTTRRGITNGGTAMNEITNVKIGGYYFANLGRKAIKTTAAYEPNVCRERVQVIGIEGDDIVVKSISDMRPEIICKVKTVWNP